MSSYNRVNASISRQLNGKVLAIRRIANKDQDECIDPLIEKGHEKYLEELRQRNSLACLINWWGRDEKL